MAPRSSDRLVVPVDVSGFPIGSPLNGSHMLDVLWDDLLWASITVGKAQRDLMRYGRYSFAEILHRVACLHAYYDIDHLNRLTLSPAFKNLDSTEKGVVSFYTGMAMAKLYADEMLSIPWMMHISRYEADWAVRYGANTNRPDLFGCNAHGEWAVAEAKGRSRVTTKLVTKMQQQKSAVASIQRVVPTHRYGSATRFEAGRLAVRVVDPPRQRRAQDVPIDPGAWLLDYYRPVVDLLDQTDARTTRVKQSSAPCPGQRSKSECPGRSPRWCVGRASGRCSAQDPGPSSQRLMEAIRRGDARSTNRPMIPSSELSSNG